MPNKQPGTGNINGPPKTDFTNFFGATNPQTPTIPQKPV
jgi:hypothetical protein